MKPQPVQPKDPKTAILFAELAIDPEGFRNWTLDQTANAQMTAKEQGVDYLSYFAWSHQIRREGQEL